MDATLGRDPLAPIDNVVTFLSLLFGLSLVAAVVGAIAAAFGAPISVLGFGDTDACATVRAGVVGFGDLSNRMVPGLRHDAFWSPENFNICVKNPSVGLRLAASMVGAPTLGFIGGFLLLLRSVIRAGRRDGLFTITVAGRTSHLGWFILLGSLLVSLVRGLAARVVVGHAVNGGIPLNGDFTFDGVLTPLLVGVGLITLGRVVRQGAVLQADADATI